MLQSSHSRTPGSRQGSPSEEDINKNGMVPDTTGGGVVMGPGAPVLGPLDHSSFEGGGAVGGIGGPAGILDPSMAGPFSSPAAQDYNNMAGMNIDSPTLLPGPGGPQPQQNFTTDNQVSLNIFIFSRIFIFIS